MKKLIKCLTFLLSLIFMFTAFGCAPADKGAGGGGGQTGGDPTKSQIKIEIVDVGMGRAYLDAIVERYEKAVENVSFEEGKTGLEIKVIPNKRNLTDDMFKNPTVDLYFGTGDEKLQTWMHDGYLLDLTSIATENLNSKYGENTTILDKLYDGAEKIYCQDNKVYALPYFIWTFGLNYNVDIWEEELLYLNKENDFIEDLDDLDGNLGTGPDGEYGTYDDGLPRTYDEFFKVLDKMSESYAVSFLNDSNREYYLDEFVEALHMNAETIDQYMLNFTFNGTANTLINEITDNATSTFTTMSPTAISNSNGYLLFKQAGLYYATKFMERLLANKDYYITDETLSNLTAQSSFVLTGAKTGYYAGMIIEGQYWEQESQENGFFKDAGRNYTRDKRRFAFMPMPMPTEAMVGQGHNVVTRGSTVVAASSRIAEWKKPIVKDFVQFCFTQKSLTDSTVLTSMYPAVKFNIQDADYERLSYYGKTVSDFYEDSLTNVKMMVSDNQLYMQNIGAFDFFRKYRSTKAEHMFEGMINKTFNAKQYFEGIYERFTKNNYWNDTYSRFFD